MLHDRIAIVGTMVLALSCAAPAARSASTHSEAPGAQGRPRYTAEERSWMSLCSALTDTVWGTAVEKKNGMKKAERLAVYDGDGPANELARKTVERVYAEDSDKPWDYSVAFFKECAAEMAKVPADRVDFGAYCAQNVLIASISFDQKKAGMSRDEVHATFDDLEGPTPRRIVDRVWASKESRAPTLMGVWNSCMDGGVE